MKKISLAVLSALTVSASLAAQAQGDFDDRWYIEPFATANIPEGDRNADVGPGGGFAIGRPINPYLNLELRGAYERFNEGSHDQDDWDNWTIGADALYFFRREGFQPFLLFGIGGIRDEVGGNSEWSFTANAGAGFLYPINDRVLFRTDVRYRWDDNSSSLGNHGDYEDTIVSVGVQIPLGERAAPAKAPPPSVPAAPPPVRKFELSADALFDFDKATLRPQGRAKLDNLLQDLRGISYDSILVVGYTDPFGSDSYNQQLSARRATTVASYLVSRGVPADRIRAEGRGETELKVTSAQCGTVRTRAAIQCYQPDRRVEVMVTGASQQ